MRLELWCGLDVRVHFPLSNHPIWPPPPSPSSLVIKRRRKRKEREEEASLPPQNCPSRHGRAARSNTSQ